MTITHNQIIQLLEDVATNHYQINGFGFGKNWEYLQSETLNTPVLWGEQGTSQRSDREVTMNYTLYLMDLVKRDDSNLQEVISDMTQIALDIVAILNSPTYSSQFLFQSSNNIEPFEWLFDNGASGVKLDISFRIPFDNDVCQVPFSGLPTII